MSDATHYIDLGVATALLDMPGALDKTSITANGTDQATINNLPQPCTVTFKDQQYEVTDGSFGFTADIHGAYTARVEAWPLSLPWRR